MNKSLRLSRILNPDTSRVFMVPMDHGTTLGPIVGVNDYITTLNTINQTDVDAIILHKGSIKRVIQFGLSFRKGVIMHMSASTSLIKGDSKVLVGNVEEALRLGCDGVSMHLNIHNHTNMNVLSELGEVSRKCDEWGMPLIVMIYGDRSDDYEETIHLLKIAQELGADIIKTSYDGDFSKLREYIDVLHVPVVLSGGQVDDSFEVTIHRVFMALNNGFSGIAFGRTVFSDNSTKLKCCILNKAIHENWSESECLAHYRRYNICGK